LVNPPHGRTSGARAVYVRCTGQTVQNKGVNHACGESGAKLRRTLHCPGKTVVHSGLSAAPRPL